MDEPTVAETLPQRYREVLDRIAELEAHGHRREAQLLRRSAIRRYAAAWNDGAIRHMERLRDRGDRVLAGDDRPRRVRPEHPAIRTIRLRLLRVPA